MACKKLGMDDGWHVEREGLAPCSRGVTTTYPPGQLCETLRWIFPHGSWWLSGLPQTSRTAVPPPHHQPAPQVKGRKWTYVRCSSKQVLLMSVQLITSTTTHQVFIRHSEEEWVLGKVIDHPVMQVFHICHCVHKALQRTSSFRLYESCTDVQSLYCTVFIIYTVQHKYKSNWEEVIHQHYCFIYQLTPSRRTYAYSARSDELIILHLCLAFLKCGSGNKKNILVSCKI